MYNQCLIGFLLVLAIIIIVIIFYCCMYNPHIPLWYETTRTPWYGVAETLPVVNNPGNAKIAVFMVATPEIKNYAEYSIKMNKQWADQHNYDFFVYDKSALPDLPINFSKIQYAIDLLETKKYNYVMYIDADAIIVNKDYDIRNLIKEYMKYSSIMFGEDCFGPKDCSKPGKINSGVFIVKSDALGVGKQILKSWKDATKGACKEFVNKFPNCQLVFSNCVFPKWFWAIRIIPYNLMNGYKGALLLKHVMATPEINRIDVLKKIYQEENTSDERIRVF